LVGATTSFFAATCGLVQNDLKRIIAMSTISQLGYPLISILIIIVYILDFFININFSYLILHAFIFLISNYFMLHKRNYSNSTNNLGITKNKMSSLQPSIKYIDKFNDFSYSGRNIIKQKYNKIKGIYLWVNNVNNKSYVVKSVNLYQRLSKYFSSKYITNNSKKMPICAAIAKYSVSQFTLYILEIVTDLSNSSDLS
jgi:NADH:ubiquinone oxidoreductase subunit 2 (subunit N)